MFYQSATYAVLTQAPTRLVNSNSNINSKDVALVGRIRRNRKKKLKKKPLDHPGPRHSRPSISRTRSVTRPLCTYADGAEAAYGHGGLSSRTGPTERRRGTTTRSGQFRRHFGNHSHEFQLYHPPRHVICSLFFLLNLVLVLILMLIGACNLMVCPIHACRYHMHNDFDANLTHL